VSCAAAVAVTQVFEEDNILANVNARSKQMLSALDQLKSSSKTSHMIADIRGKGLMIAVEFTNPSDPLTTAGLSSEQISAIPSQIGKRVQEKCIAKGLMILTTSCFDTVRFIPALVVSEEEMRVGMEIFSHALEEVAREG
jgi:4-aminobutyrate aminotransferase